MTTNARVDAITSRDFLTKDYELKVKYLTDHFTRMWTRFNYFVGIESALVGGKLIFGDGKLTTEVAFLGAAVSLIWYVMGAEDRFLVRVYRDHVEKIAELLSRTEWNPIVEGIYRHVGEVTESSKSLRWEISGWRVERISTTNLAAWIPLSAFLVWVVVIAVSATAN